jgi:dynein heavy chain
VQPFLKKCFEAVKELVFSANGEISGMTSQEGEKITFAERVNPATSGTHTLCSLGAQTAGRVALMLHVLDVVYTCCVC